MRGPKQKFQLSVPHKIAEVLVPILAPPAVVDDAGFGLGLGVVGLAVPVECGLRDASFDDPRP